MVVIAPQRAPVSAPVLSTLAIVLKIPFVGRQKSRQCHVDSVSCRDLVNELALWAGASERHAGNCMPLQVAALTAGNPDGTPAISKLGDRAGPATSCGSKRERSSRPHGRSPSTRDQPARPSLVSVSVPRAEHLPRPVNFVGGKS